MTSAPKVVYDCNVFVQALLNIHGPQVAVLVRTVPQRFTYKRDPDDAHYVDLALETSSTLIVSRDKDLLSLMYANDAEANDFRSRFLHLRILDPVEFLRELARGSANP